MSDDSFMTNIREVLEWLSGLEVACKADKVHRSIPFDVEISGVRQARTKKWEGWLWEGVIMVTLVGDDLPWPTIIGPSTIVESCIESSLF